MCVSACVGGGADGYVFSQSKIQRFRFIQPPSLPTQPHPHKEHYEFINSDPDLPKTNSWSNDIQTCMQDFEAEFIKE